MPLQTTGEIVSQIPNTRARNRAQTAAYLVGVSQDIPVMSVDGINQKGAVQACYDAMAHMEPDFEVQSCSTAYKDEIYKAFPFHIPINTTNAKITTTCVEVPFAVNYPRDDMFSRICAYMEVPRDYDKLGWRLSTSPRSDAPSRLFTSQDVDNAFLAAKEAQDMKKGVFVEVVNTAPAVTQKVSKRKRGTEDLSAPSILEHLKENLKCSEHRGADIWCWVDRNTSTAQHVPLCLHDIQLWAKYLQEHPTDMTCTVLPNNTHFAKLQKTRTTALRRTPTDPVAPAIHVHMPEYSQLPEDPNVLIGSMNSYVPSVSNTHGQRLTRQFAMYLDPDEESDDDDAVDIRQFLDALAAKFSALDYHQYEDRLHSLGISYLITAAMFDAEFFVSRVGMPDGAARLFHWQVSKEMGRVDRAKQRRKAKGKKRARVMTDGKAASCMSSELLECEGK